MSSALAKFVAAQKVKKGDIDLNPQLERTPDILLELSKRKRNQVVIGFAAETTDVENYAKAKMAEKKLDAIVANDVSAKGVGFASDFNKISIYFPNAAAFFPPLDTKKNLASAIVDCAAGLIEKKRAGKA